MAVWLVSGGTELIVMRACRAAGPTLDWDPRGLMRWTPKNRVRSVVGLSAQWR